MSWWDVLLKLLNSRFRGVYTIVRPNDLPGQPYFTFAASNDLEALETARKVMNGKGYAEVWSGNRLVDIL
jgi:hypothetical protein